MRFASYLTWTSVLFLGLAMMSAAPRASAQAVSELPRPEYYLLAKELFGAGRIADAAEGFQAAAARARRVGDQKWVDSIPPLVMLGECYYEQGSLALALEQYDAALMLALANPGWIDQIEVGGEQLPALEGIAKGINWFPKSRPSRSVAVPEGVQIAVDPTQAQVDSQGNILAPVSLVTRLDATEIFRTLAVAMVRRWQVLGPLAKHSPLTEPVARLFLHTPAPSAAWVHSSWTILRGISKLSTNTPVDAATLIRSGVLLGNQFDYFMSPIALLTLAELDAQRGNYQAAVVACQDAALYAAYFEQHAELSQALGMLSICAAASQRTDLLDPLQRAAAWCAKRSTRSQVAALIGASELSIYHGNFVLADKLAKQSGMLLRAREITLPRAQAQLSFTSALLAFGQNRPALGISNLEAALKLSHGNAQTGAVVESVFQAQMTLDLLASGALTGRDAEQVLQRILAEPDAIAWQNAPLKTIAALTTSSIPAYERLLELAALRGDAERTLTRLDRLQRQRFYEALPLGGRLLCWRHAIASDLAALPQDVQQMVQQTVQRFPELRNTSGRISALVDQLRQGPLPLDERQVAGDRKKLFAELKDLSETHENQLAFQTLLRRPMSRFLPGTPQPDVLQQTLGNNDLLLAMVATSQAIFGVAITRDNIEHWQVTKLEAIDNKLKMLAVEIGLIRQPAGQLPSKVLAPNAAWRTTARELSTLLFPPNIQDLIEQSKRVILAPHDRLWYVPYELLPETSKAGAASWLERRSVTYIPTLGSLDMAFRPRVATGNTVGLVGNFFSIDKDSNQEQADRLLDGLPNSSKIFLGRKITVPSPTWLRLQTEQLLVAARVESQTGGWDAVVMPLGNAKQATLGNWMETPRRSPSSVLLPGLVTSYASGAPQNGNDIFLPACSLLFSGTQSALISRWPVGGKSTGTVLARYMEELQGSSSAQALRRSVLSEWTESFLIADEPALLPAGKEAAALCSGSHPLLWSSYMTFGDAATTN